jgi:hypothetical protein
MMSIFIIIAAKKKTAEGLRTQAAMDKASS